VLHGYDLLCLFVLALVNCRKLAFAQFAALNKPFFEIQVFGFYFQVLDPVLDRLLVAVVKNSWPDAFTFVVNTEPKVIGALFEADHRDIEPLKRNNVRWNLLLFVTVNIQRSVSQNVVASPHGISALAHLQQLSFFDHRGVSGNNALPFLHLLLRVGARGYPERLFGRLKFIVGWNFHLFIGGLFVNVCEACSFIFFSLYHEVGHCGFVGKLLADHILALPPRWRPVKVFTGDFT